jgi:dethiobiotin synthetase
MLKIFITGSDINAGETFITAGLAATMQSLGYSTCVYKPVDTGVIEKNGFTQSPDLSFVKNIDPYIKIYSSYLLKTPAIPIIAAETENIIINLQGIKNDYESIIKENDCAIVAGNGGIMTPIAPNIVFANIIKLLELPVLIVVKPESNNLNQTLLTINHSITNGIKVRGVIINNFQENIHNDLKIIPRLIEEYSDAKILGIVQNLNNAQKINPNDLITNVLNGIDIESVFDVKIPKLEII